MRDSKGVSLRMNSAGYGRLLRALIFTWVLLTGCGGNELTVREARTQVWHELTSPHFVLSTNVEVAEAQELVTELELGYYVLQTFAFPSEPRLETSTHVAVFEGLEHVEPLGYPYRAQGVYLHSPGGTSNFPPIAVLAGSGLDRNRRVLYHELCHRFVSFYYPQLPPWLNEGLAEYYSTLELDAEGVRFGKHLSNVSFSNQGHGFALVDDEYHLVIPTGDVPSIERLRGLSAAEFYAFDSDAPASRAAKDRRAINYAAGWAAVHTLLDVAGGRERFTLYLNALRQGGLGEEGAWQRAYGDMPGEQLEREFRKFLVAHATTTVRVGFTRPASKPAAVRPMLPSEVHLLWARARNPNDPAAARAAEADVDAAIEVAAEQPEPYLYRGLSRLARKDLTGAEQDTRRAFALGKGDVRYTHSLALVLAEQTNRNPDDRARREEFDKVMSRLAKDASSSAELNLVARYLFRQQKLSSARHFAVRALRSDPSCYRCLETLAMIAAAAGNAKLAVDLQTSALNRMPHGLEDPKLASDLARYRALLGDGDREPGASAAVARACKTNGELGVLTLSSLSVSGRWVAPYSEYRSVIPQGAKEVERSPDIERYLGDVHACLNPLFAGSFLASLDSLPVENPLSNRGLSAVVEIVLDRSGALQRSGIVRSSGSTEFDAAAVSAVGRVFPLGAPPAVAVAHNGRVHLHWEFRRDPEQACPTSLARVLVP